MPHQAHLPALVGDTHADAALGELAACGLVSAVGTRYRLAAGVPAQLEAAGYADDADEQARAAAQHYAWWTGHPSVTPERVCAEADAVLAALTPLSPLTTAGAEGEESTAVKLARSAAPAFAAGLRWSAWERVLRAGAEAARLAGDVGEQAYFHHELGVHALCSGRLDRARAELEASIGLRGALADKRGTVAGRRALALVADRSGMPLALLAAAADELPEDRFEEPAAPPRAVPTAFPDLQPPADTGMVVNPTMPVAYPPSSSRPPSSQAKAGGGLKGLAKRNLVAAGAGALLVAVLGTVVTLGATSENDAGNPSENVGVNPSASQGADDGGLDADPVAGNEGDTGEAPSRPTDPGPDGTVGTSDDPTPTADESGSPRTGRAARRSRTIRRHPRRTRPSRRSRTPRRPRRPRIRIRATRSPRSRRAVPRRRRTIPPRRSSRPPTRRATPPRPLPWSPTRAPRRAPAPPTARSRSSDPADVRGPGPEGTRPSSS
ncbi:hypothetical protein SHKM778_17260 [Streptomyces sp. KM77-8]|uniref:ATP-binding protein n=1 Tax=Streptomyces haneummycinicus TaxID=3074435 RepID=A0AAT9HDB4_9ACTN